MKDKDDFVENVLFIIIIVFTLIIFSSLKYIIKFHKPLKNVDTLTVYLFN